MMWINLNSFPQDIVKFSQFSALRHFIHGGAGETFTFLTRMLSIEGLVATGMIAKFGAAYWVLSALALGLQFAMIALVLILARKHFAKNSAAALAPAE